VCVCVCVCVCVDLTDPNSDMMVINALLV
jgi:hypothetical protein